MSAARYAIYFVPAAQSALYQIGAALLGYDVYDGALLPFPDDLAASPDAWSDLTRAPRLYGFHATLKAPFRLRPGRSAEELAAHFKTFAARTRAGVVIVPALRQIESFAALVPREPSAALDALAADCVQAFDEFRAPLSDEDRRKRLAAPLSAQHQANLERWGYPHVFEEFRFHMTLTGRIPPAQSAEVLAYLRRKLITIEGRPLPIDRLALLCQPSPQAPFRLVASAPLTAAF